MQNIIIRLEEQNDWKAVEILVRKAFWREERIAKIGIGATEHYMVHAMRGNEGIAELTFVAELEGKIVGHILYSKGSYILKPDGEKVDVLNFGPISVDPAYQGLGIGGQLMEHSIQCAKTLGYGAILFFGHPTYYPKFGFKEAKVYDITTEEGDNFPAFMAMALDEKYLEGVSGKFIEAAIYNEHLTKAPAKAFDELFMKTMTH